MLKNCTIFSFILMFSFLSLLLCNFKNIILLILIQALIFSLIIYPAFCGLFQNKILACFNRTTWFACSLHGLLLFLIAHVSGAAFTVPFVVLFKTAPSNFKLATCPIGGLFLTLWLLFLAKWAFVPACFKRSKKFRTCCLRSFRLTKNNKLEAFNLVLKACFCLLFPLAWPWALKNFVTKINAISSAQNLKIYVPKQSSHLQEQSHRLMQ